jgi:hypothetical protein
MGAGSVCVPIICNKKKRKVESEVDGMKHVSKKDFD